MDWGEQYGPNRFEWKEANQTDCPAFVARHLNERMTAMESRVNDLFHTARFFNIPVPPRQPEPVPPPQSRVAPRSMNRGLEQQQQPQTVSHYNRPTSTITSANRSPILETLFKPSNPINFDELFRPSTSAYDVFRQPIILSTSRGQQNVFGQSSSNLPAIASHAHASSSAVVSNANRPASIRQPHPHTIEQPSPLSIAAVSAAQLEMPLYVQPSTIFSAENDYNKAYCDICGYSAYQVTSVKRHILRKHAKAKILCNRCGKAFTSNDNLRRHQKTTKKCLAKAKK